jgi:hypothetical protein
MKEKVISRIRKMLAIANDASASEGERENALRMAYSTMAKYNLDIAETNVADEVRMIESDVRASNPWSRTIMMVVSELFFCNYFFVRGWSGNKDRHYFVGLKSNAETAKEMAFFVVNSVSKESNKLRQGAAAARSFCEGATTAIVIRCASLRRQAEKQNNDESTGTSVVLASLYEKEREENEKFLAAQGINVKTGTRKVSGIESNAYNSGMVYGAKVQLNRQVK